MMKKITSWLAIPLIIAAIMMGRYLYFIPKYDKGEVVPDIKGLLIDGRPFSLNDLRGTYVLLDFWGSWCGPCRAENPALVSLFMESKFKQWPLEVVSIGIESKEEAWRAAIQQDGLTWPSHLSDFQMFSSPIAKAFGIRQIPTKLLISPDGVLLSTNPSFEEIATIMSKSAKK